jgi:hypothetical protein
MSYDPNEYIIGWRDFATGWLLVVVSLVGFSTLGLSGAPRLAASAAGYYVKSPIGSESTLDKKICSTSGRSDGVFIDTYREGQGLAEPIS